MKDLKETRHPVHGIRKTLNNERGTGVGNSHRGVRSDSIRGSKRGFFFFSFSSFLMKKRATWLAARYSKRVSVYSLRQTDKTHLPFEKYSKLGTRFKRVLNPFSVEQRCIVVGYTREKCRGRRCTLCASHYR